MVVGRRNDVLDGWGNYMCLGPVSTAASTARSCVQIRVRSRAFMNNPG